MKRLMSTNHEDLDTRMVLHDLVATAVGYKRNVGKCHDTDQIRISDVFIL